MKKSKEILWEMRNLEAKDGLIKRQLLLKGKNLVNGRGKLLRDIKEGNFSQIKTY